MATADESVPYWIKAGTPVVVCTMGEEGHARVSTILRVATQSFVLSDWPTERYKIRTQQYSSGVPWGFTRRCLPLDSDEGRRVLAVCRRRTLTRQAEKLFDRWRRTGSDTDRYALVDVLISVPSQPIQQEPS